jgi:hypothetical protein
MIHLFRYFANLVLDWTTDFVSTFRCMRRQVVEHITKYVGCSVHNVRYLPEAVSRESSIEL